MLPHLFHSYIVKKDNGNQSGISASRPSASAATNEAMYSAL